MRVFSDILRDCLDQGVGLPVPNPADPPEKWVRKTLCEELGVNPTTLRSWENGIRPKDANFIDLRRMLTPQPDAPDRHRELHAELAACFLAGPQEVHDDDAFDGDAITALPDMSIAPRRKKNFAACVVAFLGVLAASAIWQPWSQVPPRTSIDFDGQPSIAVLPFERPSSDDEQTYIALGMTDDIITDLSKLNGLDVIARTTSFSYTGAEADVRKIGAELDVGAVLQGSVRRIGDRLRINVQLVNTTDATHIWADRYDVPYEDVAEVQDAVTAKILTELDVALADGEQARIWRSTTVDPEAYDIYLSARNRFVADLSKEATRAIITEMDRALSIDPDFIAAQMLRGWGHFNLHKYLEDGEDVAEEAKRVAEAVIEVDPNYGEAYTLLANSLYLLGDVQGYFQASAKSVEVSPSAAKVLAFHSYTLSDLGRTDEAIAMIKRAIRLSPAKESWYSQTLGYAYLFSGQYEASIEPMKRCADALPEFLGCHQLLIPAYAAIGRMEDARASALEVLRLNPNFSIEKHSYWVSNAKDAVDKEWRTNLLLDAGLSR